MGGLCLTTEQKKKYCNGRIVHDFSSGYLADRELKGNSHQILLSEMSLPRAEVLIEKLLSKILGRLRK